MTDPQESSSQGKKSWWRDKAIVVGIIGVIATIVVGAVTYWLTAGTVSREYDERVKAARNEILAAVGRSIGEGVVPNKEKIQAVISSVDRQYRVKEQDSEKAEAIIDDIVERVLANEFLDAKRREELSTKLLAVKDEKTSSPAEIQSKQASEPQNPAPLELALLFATVTALATAIVGGRLVVRHREYPFLMLRALTPLLALLLLALLASVLLSASPIGKQILKWLQPR